MGVTPDPFREVSPRSLEIPQAGDLRFLRGPDFSPDSPVVRWYRKSVREEARAKLELRRGSYPLQARPPVAESVNPSAQSAIGGTLKQAHWFCIFAFLYIGFVVRFCRSPVYAEAMVGSADISRSRRMYRSLETW